MCSHSLPTVPRIPGLSLPMLQLGSVSIFFRDFPTLDEDYEQCLCPFPLFSRTIWVSKLYRIHVLETHSFLRDPGLWNR